MADTLIYLVLIETSGNQRHIFETNKLAENVGASEQIYRAGYRFVLDAVGNVLQQDSLTPEDVSDKSKNPPIEDPNGREVEVWYVSSGKALLLVRERSVGVGIIRHVTTNVLSKFPGVTARGTVSKEAFPLRHVTRLAEEVRSVHEQMELKRSLLPPGELRFQRLSIVDECRTSGLPASVMVKEGPRSFAASEVVAHKRKFQCDAIGRMQQLINSHAEEPADQLEIAKNIEHLERGLNERRYLAVIHADGNSIGKIFQEFHTRTQQTDVRSYITSLRDFSLGIDECTRNAFAAAIRKLAESNPNAVAEHTLGWKVPVLPLIVGGDDVTLLCTGEIAIPLLEQFFIQFEQRVQHTKAVSSVVDTFDAKRIGMAAGIAFVKPHYPFYAAYQMAEDLVQSAKQVKRFLTANGNPWPVTAFDFHVHHSSSGDSIDVIREELKIRGSKASEGTEEESAIAWTRLWGGPYVVTDDETGESLLSGADLEWLNAHRWKQVKKWAKALNRKEVDDSGRTLLPRSQMHELRAALFEGQKSFQAQVDLIRHRYENSGLDEILGQNGVFHVEKDGAESVQVTSLLNAITLAKLGMDDESSDSETLSISQGES